MNRKIQHLHFSKNISHDASTLILSHIGELGPAQCMVEIVLHLIILRQAEQVTVLHIEQIFRLIVKKTIDVHIYELSTIDWTHTLAFLMFMVNLTCRDGENTRHEAH